MVSSTTVRLSTMLDADLELLLAWRSQPSIYKFFKQQNGPLTWNEHVTFWNSRQHREDYLIEYHENSRWRKVGSVNLSKLDTEYPEIGILIGEVTLQGKQIGTKSIQLALEVLKKMDHEKASVSIHDQNTASIRLFSGFGFVQTGDTTTSWKEYKLESIP